MGYPSLPLQSTWRCEGDMGCVGGTLGAADTDHGSQGWDGGGVLMLVAPLVQLMSLLQLLYINHLPRFTDRKSGHFCTFTLVLILQPSRYKSW